MRKTNDPTYDYEVLSYDATVELLDPEGREAVYVRKERIRFLQDRVTTLEDYGWGSGIAFAGYEVYPGRLARRQLIGSRLRGTVQLPQQYHRGDELTFSVERVIKNGFTSPSECWLEAELYHAAQHVTLRVVLPGTRAVLSAQLVRPGTHGSRALRVKRLSGRRQCIAFDDANPVQGQRYTLLWDW